MTLLTLKPPFRIFQQIHRKLLTFHNSNSKSYIPLAYKLNKNTKYSLGKVVELTESKVVFSFINVDGFKFTSSHPDNVCLLSDENILVMHEIFSVKNCKHKCDDIFLNGRIFNEMEDFFNYPLSSKEIGVYIVRNLNINVTISIHIVEAKCILTKAFNETIVPSLLHK